MDNKKIYELQKRFAGFEGFVNDLGTQVYIIGTEDELWMEYCNTLDTLSQKHGLEANTNDFDFERIYVKGYKDEEDWNDFYICSVTRNLVEVGETEDNEPIYHLEIELV